MIELGKKPEIQILNKSYGNKKLSVFWYLHRFYQNLQSDAKNLSSIMITLFPDIFGNSLTFPDQRLSYTLIACGIVSARNALIEIYLVFSHSENFKFTCSLPSGHRRRNRVVVATVTTSLNIGRKH